MKSRGSQSRIGRAAIVVAALYCAHAEIIDRVAVSVGSQVITASEIDRQLRITAFLNDTPLDLSPKARREAADRLVEQRLVHKELELSRFPQPSAEQVEDGLAKLKARYGGDAKFAGALARYGLTETDIRKHLLWQATLLRFIAIRFRPGIQVTEQEISDYFEKTIVPLARAARPAERPSLEDYRAQIEERLAGERVDKELADWLRDTRERTRIDYHQEVFK